MIKSLKSLFAVLGASALTLSTPALACQGPQFERSLVFLSAEPAAEVPEGMQQFLVSISERSLRNLHERDLMQVNLLDPETGQRLRVDGQPSALSVVLPVGTSCDHIRVPAPGQYYIVANLVRNEASDYVMIRGGALAYPRFNSEPRGLLRIETAQ